MQHILKSHQWHLLSRTITDTPCAFLFSLIFSKREHTILNKFKKTKLHIMVAI